MTKFDLEAARANREKFPHLTIFDTGEMLEPKLHRDLPNEWGKKGRKSGPVDFENDSCETELTLYACPSVVKDDTIVLSIDTSLMAELTIIVNDGDLGHIDHDGNPHFAFPEDLIEDTRDAVKSAMLRNEYDEPELWADTRASLIAVLDRFMELSMGGEDE